MQHLLESPIKSFLPSLTDSLTFTHKATQLEPSSQIVFKRVAALKEVPKSVVTHLHLTYLLLLVRHSFSRNMQNTLIDEDSVQVCKRVLYDRQIPDFALIHFKQWGENVLGENFKELLFHVVGLALVDRNLHPIFNTLDLDNALRLAQEVEALGAHLRGFNISGVGQLEVDLAETKGRERKKGMLFEALVLGILDNPVQEVQNREFVLVWTAF
jgi:hypothetical protein